MREKIYQIVSSMKGLDIVENDHIQFACQWIKSGCEIFRIQKPATPDIHLVSYFVIVSLERDQILLVDHIKAELWLPPGGHVEPDEDPKETVRREAKEELGIEAEFLYEEPIFLTVTQTTGKVEKHSDVSLWYVLKGNPSHFLNYDREEFIQIQWFDFNKIPFENSDPNMRRFIQKFLMFEKAGFASKACTDIISL